jgi:hypothetical protein
MNDRAEEAGKWLKIALDGGLPAVQLQWSYLALDAGQEEEALAHL